MSTVDEKDELTMESLAEQHGVAVVVVDEESVEVASANNNSICSQLYDSPDFGAACAEYCGKAFAMVSAAGDAVDYECHAGLVCRAVPVVREGKQLVAIVGRTFLRSENYRRATEKAAAGDWRRFPQNELFDNVLLSASPIPIEQLGRQIGSLQKPIAADVPARSGRKAKPKPAEVDTPPMVVEDTPSTSPDPFETSLLNYKLPDQERDTIAESPMVAGDQTLGDREAWRAFIPTLLKVTYRLACRRILEFLARQYGIESSLWLQRDGQQFEMAAVLGELEDKPVRIDIPVDDKRIRAAVRDDSPIVLREVQAVANKKARVIQLFPVVIGGEVRNALGIARDEISPELSGRILNFCRYVASRLEILRLRDAVEQQARIGRILKDFNDQLRDIDSENVWQELMAIMARLVHAERASLLVVGPAEELRAKATFGSPTDISAFSDLGSRVARTILENGKPALVADVGKASLASVDVERLYKSPSFISYPILFAGEGIGVMNFTDKQGGERFDKHDLEVLDSVAPQIAVALDRVALRRQVGEFAQLSVTDPLTGLLNRRYLKERLAEEINRSDRSGEPLSFLMMDVDEFKAYNDRFGHPAGDEALRMVGSILRQNLRGADVAVRYGGEEFSAMLPATSVDEAETIAQRIRMHVERTEFPRRKVTLSIGVATLTPELTAVDALVSAADKALLRAKAMGRNNVQVYDPLMDGEDNVH